MKYHQFDVVFQEVPNEISLCFSMSGCKLDCINCNWKGFTDIEKDIDLTEEIFRSMLSKYACCATCVLFMGGEWDKDNLIKYLMIARSEYGLLTCLYTGLEEIDKDIKKQLDYVKLGPYKEELGALDKKTTNQRFIDVKTGKCLNNLFQK